MKRSFVLVFILSFFGPFAKAQNESGFGLHARTGFLFAHRATMGHLIQEKVHSVEMNYFRNLKDTTSWAGNYPWATVGISGLYTSTGNTKVLGHGFGLFAFGELGFVNLKKFKIGTRTGFGLGYLTKKFDQEKNLKNIAIGSHFNLTVLLGLVFKYELTKGELIFSTDMTHFSNASWTMPNLGVNYPMLSLGYRKTCFEKRPNFLLPLHQQSSKLETTLFGSVAGKSVFPTNGRRYFIGELGAALSKKLGHRAGLEISVDALYRGSTMGFATEFEKKKIDLVQIATNVGGNFYFNRFTANASVGVYVRDVYRPTEWLYQKLGLRYQLNSSFSIHLFLKAIYGRADYMGWGIAYKFKTKKA